jgi:uncharacterized protein (TIGR02145 family)
MDGSYDASADYTRTSTFVMDDVRNTLAVYKGFRGDICQYLSKTGAVPKGYRLPMANEFGSRPDLVGYDGWSYGGQAFGNHSSLANQYGTGILIRDQDQEQLISPNIAYAVNSILGIRLPTSSVRMNDGYLGGVGYTGYYWTGSAYNANHASLFRCFSATIELSHDDRYDAMSVRCVKN